MSNHGIASQDQEFLGQLFRFIDLSKIDKTTKQQFIEKPFSVDLSPCFNKDSVSGNSILRLLSTNDKPVIKATDGQRFLAKAEDTFKSYIDSDFKDWKLNKTSKAMLDTPTDVYEMVNDATFAQMFGSLSNDLDKLCLTQDQIEEFCLAHPDQLRADGYGTFFLFKENEQFFVASVDVDSDGLYVNVHRLERGRVWDSGNRHRVVVPQL